MKKKKPVTKPKKPPILEKTIEVKTRVSAKEKLLDFYGELNSIIMLMGADTDPAHRLLLTGLASKMKGALK